MAEAAKVTEVAEAEIATVVGKGTVVVFWIGKVVGWCSISIGVYRSHDDGVLGRRGGWLVPSLPRCRGWEVTVVVAMAAAVIGVGEEAAVIEMVEAAAATVVVEAVAVTEVVEAAAATAAM